MHWGYHYLGMHLFWWFFWVLVVIGALYWMKPIEHRRRDTAIEALRRSYAKGAITEDEYRHRLGVLTEQDRRAPPAGRTEVGGGTPTDAPQG